MKRKNRKSGPEPMLNHYSAFPGAPRMLTPEQYSAVCANIRLARDGKLVMAKVGARNVDANGSEVPA